MVTAQGRANLGRLVEQARKSAEVKALVENWLQSHHPHQQVRDFVERSQFAQWLTAQADMSDEPITSAAIDRLERGEGRDGPPMKVMLGLVRAKILTRSDNTPYTHDDLVAVLTEELDPFTH